MSEYEPTVDEAIELVKKASHAEELPCPHCGGDGFIDGPKRRIHTRRGPFGADNDLDSILKEIAKADYLGVGQYVFGPVLVVAKGESTLLVDL